VVTPQGEIWSGLRGLRKDNTGYDLRDLFIGAEGTLGVITGAVLKLYPQPKACITALAAALACPRAAMLVLMQDHCGASLTGFELMSRYCLSWWRNSSRSCRALRRAACAVRAAGIVEQRIGAHAVGLLERAIGAALERGVIDDVVGDLGGAIGRPVAVARAYPAGAGQGGQEHQARYFAAGVAHCGLHRGHRAIAGCGLPRLPAGVLRPSGRRQPAFQRGAAGGRVE
jgi:FAD/FMN-containing dehydrogenase